MAFNKDISPSSLGKGQKAPRDVFQNMRQGSIPNATCPDSVSAAMKQGSLPSKAATGHVSMRKRMRQG